jgi:hypothetical protein
MFGGNGNSQAQIRAFADTWHWGLESERSYADVMQHGGRVADMLEAFRRALGDNDMLHGGHVPKWLADRMTRLGAVISEAIVHHYGRDELLRRLAHPFWFQSFGAVMGMDWHSSGITTSVIGALKRGLAPLGSELGVHVCGGRGKHSLQTPHELVAIGKRVGFDGSSLAKTSRLVAKVDSAAVQDGFDLYLHGFIVTDDSRWVVVQQGMSIAAAGPSKAVVRCSSRPIRSPGDGAAKAVWAGSSAGVSGWAAGTSDCPGGASGGASPGAAVAGFPVTG